MQQQQQPSSSACSDRPAHVHGVFAPGEGSPRHPRRRSDLSSTFNDSEMVHNRQTNPAPTHARLQARPVTSTTSHARRHAIGVGRSTHISMSVADREPGSLPYASHEHMHMQSVTQKIQTSPAVSSATSCSTSHFKVKTDVTLTAHQPPGGLWAKNDNDRPQFFSSPAIAHGPTTPRPSPGGPTTGNSSSNTPHTPQSSRSGCGIPRTDLHEYTPKKPDAHDSPSFHGIPRTDLHQSYVAKANSSPASQDYRRVAPIDLHPRSFPTHEVQEARGRGPMRISSKGTVHCSAPDTTRDFARIGDFLKKSSAGAAGGGGDAPQRPQTQGGGYKVVAPWER